MKENNIKSLFKTHFYRKKDRKDKKVYEVGGPILNFGQHNLQFIFFPFTLHAVSRNRSIGVYFWTYCPETPAWRLNFQN